MPEICPRTSSFFIGKNLKLILDNLDEGIHIVNQMGRTIVYNKKVSEIDELGPKEVLGKNIIEVYPSLTLETSTLMQTLKSGKPINSIQQTFINSKGKKITTINSTIPINFNHGKIGAMEISRDITQLKELTENITHLRTNLVNKKKKKHGKDLKIDNNTTYTFEDIIGESPNFKKILKLAMRAANSDSSVLLIGETGTGKELFAQSIHNASRRCHKPFIAQNCAALPKNLLEGLLFGTEKGGFTGAQNRPGLFEQADGGTILLDEVNSMNLALQAKLLRVLQENKVRRIGGRKEIRIDVRVIATINMHPDQALQENKLREDLFYRLSVVYIKIPPLRKRKIDIPILSDYFINYYNQSFEKDIEGISKELKKTFKIYNWPGNVRELQHVIESAFNLVQQEGLIKYKDLPGYIKDRLTNSNRMFAQINYFDLNGELPSLEGVLKKIEFNLIKNALERTEGNISAAARKLSISRQSLQYKMSKYGI